MATFKVRIEDKIGIVNDDNALSDFLTAGGKFIVNILPPERVEKFTTSLPSTGGIGGGVSVVAVRILRAHKSNYQARRVDAGLMAQLTDPDSIHFAVATDPAWYILNGLAYIVPSGGTVVAMAYPTILHSASAISAFPADLDEAVVLYACVHGRLRQMSDLTITTLGGLSIDTILPPLFNGSPSFTWTPVSYTDATYSIADYVSALYDDAEYTSAAYSAASAVDAAISNIPPISVSFLDTLAYTQLVFGGSYTGTDTALGNQDIELATGYLNKTQVQLDQYQKDMLNSLNEFNRDKGEFDANLQIALTNAQLAQQRATEDARNLIELNKFNEQQTLQAALVNAQKTAEIDLANKQAGLQLSLSNSAKELEAALANAVQESQVDLANRRAALELDITNKSKAFEVAVTNSTKELERQIQEYSAKLQAYGLEAGLYSGQINQEIARVSARINQYNVMFQQYAIGLEAIKQEFQNYIKAI